MYPVNAGAAVLPRADVGGQQVDGGEISRGVHAVRLGCDEVEPVEGRKGVGKVVWESAGFRHPRANHKEVLDNAVERIKVVFSPTSPRVNLARVTDVDIFGHDACRVFSPNK